MFKITGDRIEYDGWFVGVLVASLGTVRNDVIDALEGYDPDDEELELHDACESQINDLQNQLDEANDTITELRNELDGVKGDLYLATNRTHVE